MRLVQQARGCRAVAAFRPDRGKADQRIRLPDPVGKAGEQPPGVEIAPLRPHQIPAGKRHVAEPVQRIRLPPGVAQHGEGVAGLPVGPLGVLRPSRAPGGERLAERGVGFRSGDGRAHLGSRALPGRLSPGPDLFGQRRGGAICKVRRVRRGGANAAFSNVRRVRRGGDGRGGVGAAGKAAMRHHLHQRRAEQQHQRRGEGPPAHPMTPAALAPGEHPGINQQQVDAA